MLEVNKYYTFYLTSGVKLKGKVVGLEPVYGVPALQLTDYNGGVQDVFIHAIGTRQQPIMDDSYGA